MKALKAIVVFLVISCQNSDSKGVEVQLVNQSENAITQIKFYTSGGKDTLELHALEPNETFEGFLSMEFEQSDGTYILDLKRQNLQMDHFMNGYYANGAPLDKKIVVTILPDTVMWHFRQLDY
ncbi:hypothetical protein [Robiginitalea sp. SC105]|uniref:hypothetical protein n=1 Tax=Robiginitalea sp. SC105 TaxID=2762332 RepID=UPI00163A3AEE|nr:hypothetical protein [Robiginitalea sp. SC105]MBC2839723.1 hypothetical protein [Robiginitalea sp. SC105]